MTPAHPSPRVCRCSALSAWSSCWPGVALVVLNLVVCVAMSKGAEAPADPWGGLTPEWLLPSPPPLGPAEALPELTSGTPLLDAELNGNGLNGSGAAVERDAHEVPA